MHTPEEQAWRGDDLFDEITIANVADVRDRRSKSVVEIVVRHPDLSAPISLGRVYTQAPFGNVLEAVEEALATFLMCVETGVSEEERSALPPSRVRRTLSGPLVALARLVRGGGLQ